MIAGEKCVKLEQCKQTITDLWPHENIVMTGKFSGRSNRPRETLMDCLRQQHEGILVMELIQSTQEWDLWRYKSWHELAMEVMLLNVVTVRFVEICEGLHELAMEVMMLNVVIVFLFC